MSSPVFLEVCVETVASAVAAESGGAHRIELCSNLAVEGVTPNPTLIEQVRRRVGIPLHILIRPRAGDFHYSASEFDAIKNEIRQAKLLGANGLVFGALDSNSRVDVLRTCELVELARPLSVTFHRAFDACADLPTALEEVIRSGADRVLTSGGAPTADEGAAMLAQLVKSAAGRIEIMACGRIREENIRRIVEATAVCEVHTSLLPRSPDQKCAGAVGKETGLKDFVLSPEAVARLLEAAAKGPSKAAYDR
jgi:copper homeostasis protein